MPALEFIHKPLEAAVYIAHNPDVTPLPAINSLIHKASSQEYSGYRKNSA